MRQPAVISHSARISAGPPSGYNSASHSYPWATKGTDLWPIDGSGVARTGRRVAGLTLAVTALGTGVGTTVCPVYLPRQRRFGGLATVSSCR